MIISTTFRRFLHKDCIYKTILFSKNYDMKFRTDCVLKIRIHYGNEPAPIMDSEFFCDLRRQHEYVNAIIALHLFLSALAFFDRLNGVVDRCRCICHYRSSRANRNDCFGNRHCRCCCCCCNKTNHINAPPKSINPMYPPLNAVFFLPMDRIHIFLQALTPARCFPLHCSQASVIHLPFVFFPAEEMQAFPFNGAYWLPLS